MPAAGPSGSHMLPVWAGKDTIVKRIRENATVILVGETGSGKTTQVPQFLFQEGIVPRHGRQMIGITQPRRVAATSLASRVADEMGCRDPAVLTHKDDGRSEYVGYSVRFEDRTSKQTRIKFMTDGMLIREILGPVEGAAETCAPNSRAANARLLKRYSVLIIDEAHERSLRTDVLLGLAKQIQQERQRLVDAKELGATPLKLVIMSATIDAEAFARFFRSADPIPILYVAGRQHGVRLYYTEESCQDWTDAAVRAVMQIHVSKPPGDILLFATGQEEIESLAQSLQLFASQVDAWAEEQGFPSAQELLVRPLYAALGPAAAAAAFAPTPERTRKVVLATNIAETSITIPGIRYVIDSGLVKEKVFSPQTGVETLQVHPISQSSSVQRAGRAGREGPGMCFRLYTKDAFAALPKVPVPEIHRTELSGVALQLYAMALDPFHFDWIDPPETAMLQEAVLHLAELGAITCAKGRDVQLTQLGRQLALLPITPSYARLLLAAAERGPTVARQARDLVSILSADRSMFVESRDPERKEAVDKARDIFTDPSGDHATYLKALQAYLNVKAHASGEKASAKHELCSWCHAHGIRERTMRNILAIRKQLVRICSQHAIRCDDDDNGAGKRMRSASPDDDLDEEPGLFVTRGAIHADGVGESFDDLLQCLGKGRVTNIALRQPDGSFRRIAGGPLFKLHPASTLHPARHTARGSLASAVQAVVFEELMLTSQTFARTVSRIEPAWLQALIARTT